MCRFWTLEKCEKTMPAAVFRSTAAPGLRCNTHPLLLWSARVTITLRCLNCGFSFTVTYAAPEVTPENSLPLICGHCRSTHWSSQARPA
jgi:hypothetical protein